MRTQHEKFRIEEVKYITDQWLAGEAVSMVGVGSIGKSNLLQHLTRTESYQNALGLKQNPYHAIILDPYMLGPLPSTGEDSSQFICWAGLELIMHRIYMTFFSLDLLNPDDSQYFNRLYNMLQNSNNSLALYMGLRYLELSLKLLMSYNIKIILLFDEFEEFLRIMPHRYFQILRGLRDTFKGSLVFTTFARNTFPILIEEKKLDYYQIEPFIELFTDNVLFVGPYNDYDARLMLDNLAQRSPSIKYTPQDHTLILQITGKFAGLIRATYKILEEIYINRRLTNKDEVKVLEHLIDKRSIQTECRTIWLSLSDIERDILKAVARLSPYQDSIKHEEAIRILIQKRLLVFNENRLEIVPALFRYFVYSNPEQ